MRGFRRPKAVSTLMSVLCWDKSCTGCARIYRAQATINVTWIWFIRTLHTSPPIYYPSTLTRIFLRTTNTTTDPPPPRHHSVAAASIAMRTSLPLPCDDLAALPRRHQSSGWTQATYSWWIGWVAPTANIFSVFNATRKLCQNFASCTVYSWIDAYSFELLVPSAFCELL